MSHKKKHGAPVPPGNRVQKDPKAAGDKSLDKGAAEVSSAQEKDPKGRQGGFDGKAEHSIQEPGGKNGANRGG